METFDVEPTARWVPYYSPVATPIEHDSDHAHDMFAPQAAKVSIREDLIAEAGQYFGSVIRRLYEGVAFYDRVKGVYHIFSHEGDELGDARIADVQFVVCYMKRQGIMVGKLVDRDAGPGHPSLTFAWTGWFQW